MIRFAGRTHDRRHDLRQDDAWMARAWADPATRVLVLGGSRLRLRDDRLDWTGTAEAPDGLRVLLGEEDGGVSFAVLGDDGLADGESWQGLRAVLPALGDDDASYALHAVGLAEWHRVTRFCPRCGGRLTARSSGHLLVCSSCGRQQFPRTDPAVIMAITDDADRILLGRQRVWPERRFSTLAGFVEPGESLEQAVRREVLEEVGVTVGDATYVGSQPWPLPASLMVGFAGLAETTELRVDGEEIAEAAWFTRDEVGDLASSGGFTLPGRVSISRALIERWYGEALPGQWS